jgi:hypothetical protein
MVPRSLFTVHCLPFTPYLSPAVWTGVRVAEGAGLENRCTRKGIVGSNPTLSAVITSLTPNHLKSFLSSAAST